MLVSVLVIAGAALVVTDVLRSDSFDSPSDEAYAADARLGSRVTRGAGRAPLPSSEVPARTAGPVAEPTPDPRSPGAASGHVADQRTGGESPLPDGAPVAVSARSADRILQRSGRQLDRAAGEASKQSLGRDGDGGSGSPRTGGTDAGDDTAPRTTLLPGSVLADTSELRFTANEPATFSCSLDGGSFQPCTSGQEYGDLGAGWHTFAVRATDMAGNVDQSPDSSRWHTSESGKDASGPGKVGTPKSD
ncbi:MAG: hypothetical protein ACRDOY_07285 [Nocardioidaceae bacterium]